MTVLAQRTAEPEQPRTSGPLDNSSQLRFLLIEDSTTDSELVRALLEDEFPNGDVDVASSLELALGCLAGSEYDLILADLTLPDAEGEVVVSTVREAFPHVALMVLTGRVDGTLALWTLAEGAQDYLVKGQHDGPRLAEAMLRGLQRSRTEQMAHARLVAALELESKAAERLRALDTAKDDFVATASHELRTPLTSVVAYAEMLADEVGLTVRQTEFVAVIVRNAARLTALTENLLLLSRFNSTQLQLEAREVDLRAVVSSAKEVIETLAIEKHLDVRFELPDHPVRVSGNAGQLERVVLNLVSNAIKFTEDEGTITCRITTSATEVFISVIDTGIGIPAAEQAHLFDKFFRGAGARDRAIQGTGLGLHIAASIVSNHGGEVSVDSVNGLGSTFTVRLPAVP
jgi:signal transduction histidine kinase